ncbi:MAG: hypothetical protein HY909_23345 [Deltaproteobacteria bacterium]|nr:hypothetical protein [Deltaproteobacteria bacterium]
MVALWALGCARGIVLEDPEGGAPMDGGDAPDVGMDGPEGTSGCARDEDCQASLAGPLCDLALGRCVACIPSQDRCPPGQFCDPAGRTCLSGCTSDADCGAKGSVTRCDPSTHRCVGCTTDDHCAPGTLCRGGQCLPGCTDAHGCGVGRTCCAGGCVDTSASVMHCGGCGMLCAETAACCRGACARIMVDSAHCGGCGVACAAPNATASCVEGRCAVGACDAGYADCDRAAANGCEAELATDPLHCGMCGVACPSGTRATARCALGVCGVECAAGYGDCNREPGDGCEAALPTDVAHCGACGRRCAAPDHATASCEMGLCGFRCEAGYGDCDGDGANGCEASLAEDARHCGGCGMACRLPNATAACRAARCERVSCDAGFGDCDGVASNGCETPTVKDPMNCGACGVRCGAGTACSAGACASVCAAGTTFCAGRCVTTASDPEHCGRCGARCAAGANATARCAAGACSLQCGVGFGDCNGAAGDGCEVDLRAAVAHCGACGGACARAHATPACVAGSCRVGRCDPDYADCDGSDATGCEASTAGDARNCGGCGRVCALASAAARCAGGVCAVASCLAGSANCNGRDADGCEVDTQRDNFNCGGCGSLCPPGTACSAGSCASVCAPGTTFCAGSCVDTRSDARNCGACGRLCAAGQSCVAGACVSPGPANDRCAAARVLSLSSAGFDVVASTVGAAHDLNAPCGGSAQGGADVFFQFTIPSSGPELVYADTFGSGYDTVLYFASSCGAARTGSTTPGDAVCNDDAGTVGCFSAGLQSQVVALLNPGTHYLVLGGYSSQTGSATIHFQHLPVGNGAVGLLPSGSATVSGTTSGAGRVSGSCGGGLAPENTFWWRSCPETRGGTFSATTCTRATWDTVLYLLNGNGAGNVCNDDACALQSTITSTLPGGAGLHALYVDGFFTATGTYTVATVRP